MAAFPTRTYAVMVMAVWDRLILLTLQLARPLLQRNLDV